MRRLLLACLLSACATEVDEPLVEIPPDNVRQPLPASPPFRIVAVYFDPECLPIPTQVWDGMLLWRRYGVTVVNVGVYRNHLATTKLCLVDENFWGHRVGSTSWTPWGVETTIRVNLPTAEWITGMMAHELGHVILHSAEHLPDSACGRIDAPDPCGGIMGGRYIWPDFTELDDFWLGERGLWPVIRE